MQAELAYFVKRRLCRCLLAWLALPILSASAVAASGEKQNAYGSPRHGVDSIGPASPFRLAILRSEYRVSGEATGSNIEPKSRGGKEISPMIERHAQAQGLDPELVDAVIRTESAYRADAVSSKGAVGLMQVMPTTGMRFGVSDLRNPDSNLRVGTMYLRHLLDRFDSLPLALAAYNAGEGAITRFGNRIPPYRETEDYVRKVLGGYSRVAVQKKTPSRVYMDGVRLVNESLGPYLPAYPSRD